MTILIIIPAYNEAENIAKVIESLSDFSYEVQYIVINDCSTDMTENVLRDINANYITLPINLGIGGGVQTGYIYAKENGFDIAIQIDGDGQHDVKYLPDMIKPILEKEADMTIGSRFINNEGFQSSAMRRCGINFLSWLIKICCGIQIKDVTSGFRAVNRRMIEIYAREYAQDYPEPEAIVTATYYNAEIKEVPVEMEDRQGGRSSISSLKAMYYMIKVSLAIIFKRCFDRRKSK